MSFRGDLGPNTGVADAEVRGDASYALGFVTEEKIPSESLPKPMMEDIPGPSKEISAQDPPIPKEETTDTIKEKAPLVG
ncbi:UNVERIFIED_CONTAM: hypothetical protein Sradi_5862600 [Sesamum radiatum]|uniref:Uncharacterized protein n=1 Tax=Sesamum radiatum TaxID=300843 RepID=A0AAW2KUG2_SESRA